MPRSYFDWAALMDAVESGQFPYTPATNLIFGLRVALDMLFEEGLPAVFARHARLADATRCAVAAWGLELLCPAPAERSNTLRAVVVPGGGSAARLRDSIPGR